MTIVKVATIYLKETPHDIHFTKRPARTLACVQTCDRWVADQVIDAKQKLHEFLYHESNTAIYAIEYEAVGTYVCDSKEALMSFMTMNKSQIEKLIKLEI